MPSQTTSRAARTASGAPARQPAKPTPAWWRDAIGAACWLTALIAVALWLRGRGAQDLLGSPAAMLTSVGRITGLVAADLLLVQVFLMARVPWIERSYGQDELARRHRLVGFWSFNLMWAHVVLITFGYTLADHTDLIHESWNLVTGYAGMLLALAATTAVTAVALTSIRMARKRLRYESWHLIHLYAYLGVGFSIPHELWTGSDFMSSSLASTYWWGTYAAAAGAVLVFRVGLPVWRTLRHGITVTAVVRESDDVVTVRMGGRGLHRLPARAGQFFIWRFLDGPGWSRGNPYSLSAAPKRDRVQITAKDLGDGSGRLGQLRPGVRVLIEGPYGKLTGEDRIGTKVAMLASGIGVTPMRALLEDLAFKPGDASLLYRVSRPEDIIFREELEKLAAQRGIDLHYLIGQRIAGRSSWLPQQWSAWTERAALLQLVPDIAQRDVFICGPSAWMDAAADAAQAAGVPRARLHQERFTW